MEAERDLPDSEGVSVKTLLLDSQRWPGVEAYIQGMTPPITSSRQWGGWAEAYFIASRWRMKVLHFVQYGNDSIGLACQAYGHPHSSDYLCLLWDGTHYDALKLTPSVLELKTVQQSLPASGAQKTTTNGGVMMVASGAMAGMSRGVAGLPAHGAHHGTATHHHGLPALWARSTATRGVRWCGPLSILLEVSLHLFP